MAVADLFQSFRVTANKPFLDDANGRAWQSTLGQLMDESFARMYEARFARFPEQTPIDGLFYIASERGVEQAIGESDAVYRSVLRNSWELWRIAGTEYVHQFNLGRMGCGSVIVKRRRDLSNVPPSTSAYVTAFARDVWAQFDIILGRPMPWQLRFWGTASFLEQKSSPLLRRHRALAAAAATEKASLTTVHLSGSACQGCVAFATGALSNSSLFALAENSQDARK